MLLGIPSSEISEFEVQSSLHFPFGESKGLPFFLFPSLLLWQFILVNALLCTCRTVVVVRVYMSKSV